MNVDGALLDVHISTPDAIEQLLAAVHPFRVRHEKFQQAIFSRAQCDRALTHHDAMAGTIERQLVDANQLGFILATAAPQHCIHARNQLARRERLGHIVVGAAIQARDLIHFLGTRRQHDDRQIARIALALE